MKLHHGIKLLTLLGVNHDSALGKVKRQISDAIFKVVDLHVLPQGFHVELSESSVLIVLLHVSGTVLVKTELGT